VPTATNTPLSVAIPSPEPTDLPLAGPPPTTTPPSFTAGEVPDLLVTAIEVTQGVQNLANDMPLVEGRLTVARVYVKTQDPDVPYANVKGALAGFRNNQLLGIAYPDNGPIAAVPGGGLRTNIDDSLYFYVPGAWTSGDVLLRAFVYAGVPDAPYDEEPDESNNFFDVNVTFHPGDPLKVRLAPVHLHNPPLSFYDDITYHYDDHQTDALEIIVHMLRYHPIATDDLWFNASSYLVVDNPDSPDIAVSSIKPIGHQLDAEWDLSLGDQRDLVNERIKFFRSMAPDGYADWRWYGMVDPSVSMGGFIGWANNGVAHGLMANSTSSAFWNNTGGVALAHEIAHLYLAKPEHVPCTGTETGPDPAYPYPVPNCQLADIDPAGYYGFDTFWQLWGFPGPSIITNDPAGAASQVAFPLMGAKSPWWTDPFYYCRLLDSYSVPCDPQALNVQNDPADVPPRAHGHAAAIDLRAPLSLPMRLVRAQQTDGYVYVSARVDAAANTGAFIDVLRVADPAAAAVADSQAMLEDDPVISPWALLFGDANGGVLAVYPLPAAEAGAHGAPAGNPVFAQLLPYPADTAFIRLRMDAEILAERVVSANAPVVRVLSPNGGETVAGPVEVTWEASDADGDALTYTVMYSDDGGASWAPIATDVRETIARLPSRDGMAGSERALVRVLASDGVLTGSDDSDAAFTVPDATPRLYIAAPAPGAEFPQDSSVILIGTAFDLEDGALSGDALRWRSNVDGDLGAGAQLTTSALSRGEHEIELVATDSAGGTSRRTVGITIGESRPNQPDEDERGQAADFLINGRDEDGGGAPWLIIGIGAGVAAVVAAGAFFVVRSRRSAA
jgi:hypothetical protein